MRVPLWLLIPLVLLALLGTYFGGMFVLAMYAMARYG